MSSNGEALFGIPINSTLEELLPAPWSVWFQQALTTVLPVPGVEVSVPVTLYWTLTT